MVITMHCSANDNTRGSIALQFALACLDYETDELIIQFRVARFKQAVQQVINKLLEKLK